MAIFEDLLQDLRRQLGISQFDVGRDEDKEKEERLRSSRLLGLRRGSFDDEEEREQDVKEIARNRVPSQDFLRTNQMTASLLQQQDEERKTAEEAEKFRESLERFNLVDSEGRVRIPGANPDAGKRLRAFGEYMTRAVAASRESRENTPGPSLRGFSEFLFNFIGEELRAIGGEEGITLQEQEDVTEGEIVRRGIQELFLHPYARAFAQTGLSQERFVTGTPEEIKGVRISENSGFLDRTQSFLFGEKELKPLGMSYEGELGDDIASYTQQQVLGTDSEFVQNAVKWPVVLALTALDMQPLVPGGAARKFAGKALDEAGERFAREVAADFTRQGITGIERELRVAQARQLFVESGGQLFTQQGVQEVTETALRRLGVPAREAASSKEFVEQNLEALQTASLGLRQGSERTIPQQLFVASDEAVDAALVRAKRAPADSVFEPVNVKFDIETGRFTAVDDGLERAAIAIDAGDNIPVRITQIDGNLDDAFQSRFGFTIDDFYQQAQKGDRFFLAKPRTAVQEFNINKLGLDPELEKQIVMRLSALGLETRQVRTFNDIVKAAEELGFKGPDELLREVKGNRLVAEEVVALRDLIRTKTEFIARHTDSPAAAAALETNAALRQQVEEAAIVVDAALQKLVRGGTEAGRTVAAFRIAARTTLSPDYWFLQAKRMLGSKELTPDMQLAIREMIQNQDRIGLANFVTMLGEPTMVDKAVSIWKAGLLSSPSTHIANVLGNTTMLALESAKDIPAAVLDTFISMATGTDRTKTLGMLGMFQGMSGASAGWRRAKQFLKTGIDRPETLTRETIDLLEKANIKRKVPFKNAFVQLYTESVFRTLGAGDAFFREMAVSRSLYERARLHAINEGLTGAARRARIRHLFKNPTNEMATEAIDVAAYATFVKDTGVAGVLEDFAAGAKSRARQNSIRKSRQKAVREQRDKLADQRLAELAKTPDETGAIRRELTEQEELEIFQKARGLVDATDETRRAEVGSLKAAMLEGTMPFTRTPANIAEVIVDYSPVGFIKEIIAQLMTKDISRRRFLESVGRSMTGSGIIGLGMLAHQQGWLMGSAAPSGSRQRNTDELEGKQSNSIYFAGAWRKLDRTSPLGNLLVIGADIMQASNQPGNTPLSDYVKEGVFSTVKSFSEQSFIRGVAGTSRAISDPENFAGIFLEQTFGSVVPSGINRLAMVLDPTLRDPDTPIEAIINRLPILREGIRPRRDAFGRPIVVGASGLKGVPRMFDAFSARRASTDSLTRFLIDHNVTVGMPSRFITLEDGERRKLTVDEYDDYVRISGVAAKKRMKQQLAGRKGQSTEVLQKIVDRIYEEERKKAREKLFKDEVPSPTRRSINQLSSQRPSVRRGL